LKIAPHPKSIATQLCEILPLYYKFADKSGGERILKLCSYLTKLTPCEFAGFLFGTLCII